MNWKRKFNITRQRKFNFANHEFQDTLIYNLKSTHTGLTLYVRISIIYKYLQNICNFFIIKLKYLYYV